MSDQGKANYTAVAARIGGHFDHYDKLTPAIRAAYDAGADAVEAWLADCPVDEDAPGNEPQPAKLGAAMHALGRIGATELYRDDPRREVVAIARDAITEIAELDL